MPCYDPDSFRSYEFENLQQKKIDKLTRLLCEACQVILENRVPTKELTAWWAEHKAWDEKRKK